MTLDMRSDLERLAAGPDCEKVKPEDIKAVFCQCGILLDIRINPHHRCLRTCPKEP